MKETIDLIRHNLTTTLKPSLLEIIDNSAAHAGHAGAKKGGGHYNVTIVSDEFEKKTKTSVKTLKREINDLFRSQIMSGQVEQDIWFFIPTHLR